MNKEEMKQRTKRFALDIIRLVRSLPRSPLADTMGRQLLRAGTSVGANYRAACRAKSTADFIAKMGTVEEEIDESAYWLELLTESGVLGEEAVQSLIRTNFLLLWSLPSRLLVNAGEISADIFAH